MDRSEEAVAAGLLDAQEKAQALFDAVESQNLIRPGVAETKINDDIYALAEKMYGISRYWHKRIVRAGRNTLAPYDENPPDLTVGRMTSSFSIWARCSKNGKPISDAHSWLETIP